MTLTREVVIAKLEERLAGGVDDAKLAAWAFDQTYAYEIEEQDYEQGYAGVLDEVLDELVFLDDPNFALTEADLRDLIDLLRTAPQTDEQADEQAED